MRDVTIDGLFLGYRNRMGWFPVYRIDAVRPKLIPSRIFAHYLKENPQLKEQTTTSSRVSPSLYRVGRDSALILKARCLENQLSRTILFFDILSQPLYGYTSATSNIVRARPKYRLLVNFVYLLGKLFSQNSTRCTFQASY